MSDSFLPDVLDQGTMQIFNLVIFFTQLSMGPIASTVYDNGFSDDEDDPDFVVYVSPDP